MANSQTATVQELKDNAEFKKVLADSFGGVMYNMANIDKYNTEEILALWNRIPKATQGGVDGIVEGAINFLMGN